MAQHDYVIANQSGSSFRSDLNNALSAIVSQNSGASEPTTTYAYQTWADTTNGVLKIRNAANSAWIQLYELDGTFSLEAGSASSPALYFTGDTNTGIYSPGADQFAISTGGTARVYVGSTGSVGIGTTSPDTSLTISYSDSAFNPGIKVTNTSNTSASQAKIYAVNNSGEYIALIRNSDALGGGSALFSTGAAPLAFSTNSTERARIDSSGRLLVGTSSTVPNSNNDTLQVAGTGGANLGLSRFVATSAGPEISFYKSRNGTIGSHTVVQTDDVLGNLYFYGSSGSNYQEGARITAAIEAGTKSTTSMPSRLVFSTTADGASSPTERLRLTAAGLFQSMPIYNTTGGDAANVVVNSSGTVYRSTSSAKYKTDIETLQDEFADAVLGLRPVWYRSTCAIDNPDWSYWGFIAEEVAEIDPRLVSWKTSEVTYDEKGSAVVTDLDKPEPEGVQYDRFVPHLLNLIKRQGEAIAELQAEVAALKAS